MTTPRGLKRQTWAPPGSAPPPSASSVRALAARHPRLREACRAVGLQMKPRYTAHQVARMFGTEGPVVTRAIDLCRIPVVREAASLLAGRSTTYVEASVVDGLLATLDGRPFHLDGADADDLDELARLSCMPANMMAARIDLALGDTVLSAESRRVLGNLLAAVRRLR